MRDVVGYISLQKAGAVIVGNLPTRPERNSEIDTNGIQ